MHPYGHFCPFQFCFFDHFACVKANCKKSVVFKKIFFALGTKNTPSQRLLDKNVPIEPLKLQFLIPCSVNYKIMHSLLRGFHSVGKASKFYF